MTELSIVGVGPGSLDYVTPASRKAVQKAQIIIGAERSLRLFENDITGEKRALTAKNVNAILKYAVESAMEGKNVALLSTGDPGFSGLLGSILKRTRGKDVAVRVVSGVSSIQACAARLCMCWDTASLFTFHNSVTSEKKNAFAAAVKAGRDVMLLPDPKVFTPRGIALFLIEAGVDKATCVAVCENLTLVNERIVETTLEEALRLDFASLCVMVIRNERKSEDGV